MYKFENIIIFGDIHGNINEIINLYKKYDLYNSLFIVSGDFGVGFCKNEHKEMRRLDYFNISLKTRNNYIFAIRGNHDNPKYFNNTDYGNIKLIEDYATLNINNLNFLFIGGAISIDRKPNHYIIDNNNPKYSYKGRKLNVNYWANENVVFKPEKLNFNFNIDVVITHSAPSFCFPYSKENLKTWMLCDNELDQDINKEREILNNIYNILSEKNKIKFWFYGHYHKSYEMDKNKTKFILLDVNEYKEIRI